MVSLLRGLVSDVMHGVSGSNSNSNGQYYDGRNSNGNGQYYDGRNSNGNGQYYDPNNSAYPPPQGQYYPNRYQQQYPQQQQQQQWYQQGPSQPAAPAPYAPYAAAAIPASGHRLRHARRAMKHALKAQRRAADSGTAYYYDAPAPAPALIPVRPVPWTSSRAVMRMPAAASSSREVAEMEFEPRGLPSAGVEDVMEERGPPAYEPGSWAGKKSPQY